MPLLLEHPCAACGARITIRGARAFTPVSCPACGASCRARREIGGYQLGEVLARSGLAVIFRAHDATGAELAVKVLQPPYAAEAVDVDYFVSEVWALARLDHAHCLRIFATGTDSGLAWIAMEWLGGGSLATRLVERGRLREPEVLAIGLQAAHALAAAHAAGHLHHDLRPENLVFADARTVKVTDFGVAALYRITSRDLGTLWGRASFVPPERMRGEPEEAHSDIYTLGALLYLALTGLPPHGGDPNPLATLESIESGPVQIEQALPGLHEKTAQLVNRMLASEPTQRFQHWGEVVGLLGQAGNAVARRDAGGAQARSAERSAASGPPRRVPHRRQLALGWGFGVLGFIMAVAALAGFIVWKRHGTQPPRATATIALTASATPTPAPSTPVATPPPATPEAVAKFDWSGWKRSGFNTGVRAPKPEATRDGTGRVRVSGAGEGIRASGEEASIFGRPLERDWICTARLGVRDGATGLVVRDSTAGERLAVATWITGAGAVTTAVRKPGAAASEIATPPAPPKSNWLRITRRGGFLIMEASADGKQWKQTGKLDAAALPAKVTLGLAVWSGTRERVATAMFEQVQLKPLP